MKFIASKMPLSISRQNLIHNAPTAMVGLLFGSWMTGHQQQVGHQHPSPQTWYVMSMISFISKIGDAIAVVYEKR